MTLYTIVKKLSGEIIPVEGADSRTNEERLSNLEDVVALVDRLLFDIDLASQLQHSQQTSVREAGKFAANYLEILKKNLP
jgi:hypothetical protein